MAVKNATRLGDRRTSSVYAAITFGSAIFNGRTVAPRRSRAFIADRTPLKHGVSNSFSRAGALARVGVNEQVAFFQHADSKTRRASGRGLASLTSFPTPYRGFHRLEFRDGACRNFEGTLARV